MVLYLLLLTAAVSFALLVVRPRLELLLMGSPGQLTDISEEQEYSLSAALAGTLAGSPLNARVILAMPLGESVLATWRNQPELKPAVWLTFEMVRPADREA